MRRVEHFGFQCSARIVRLSEMVVPLAFRVLALGLRRCGVDVGVVN